MQKNLMLMTWKITLVALTVGTLALSAAPVAKSGNVVFSHPGPIVALAISPNGKLVATVSGTFDVMGRREARGSEVKIWSVATGSLVRTLTGFPDTPYDLIFSHDGARLIGGDKDRLLIWNTETGATIASENPKALLQSFSLSPDGRKVYAIGAQEEYSGPQQGWVMWTLNSETGALERKTTLPESGGTHGFRGADYAPTADLVVTVGDKPNKKVIFWKMSTGEQIRYLDLPENPYSVQFSPTGRLLAAIGTGEGVAVVDATSSPEEVRHIGSGVVYVVKFSPDAKFLAMARRDGTVSVWDPYSGKQLWEEAAHKKQASHLGFSEDGKLLVSSGDDGDVKVWKAQTGGPATFAAPAAKQKK